MYRPDEKILERYAHLLVNFALHGGTGVKPREVVQVIIPDVAKPLLIHLHKAILEAGAQPMLRFLPSGIDRTFYELASEEQLTFFPKHYLKARINLIDHSIGILADHDPKELKGIDPTRIMKAAEASKKVRNWMTEKENKGKFTWTLALYGTPAMAREAGLTLEEYWNEIIRACYLDVEDPVAKWKEMFKEIERVKNRLNNMKIERVHIEAEGIDLWVKIGEQRQWLGGGGRNIPSYEIFTSPDWRGTEGRIHFNQPLYRYGSMITDIRLTFRRGKVVEAKAKKGNDLLQAMVKRPNADKIGEFSMTDARLSRIKRFMANTLFDENMGDQYGNTHLALGMAYKDAFSGDIAKQTKNDWRRLGFNDSGEHTDIISTTKRRITAHLGNGVEKVIYENGKFTI